MTKKHYKELARRISYLGYENIPVDENYETGYNSGVKAAVKEFCSVAKQENQNFDRKRFLTACGIE